MPDNKSAHSKRAPRAQIKDNFYETMPMSMGGSYTYQDNTTNDFTEAHDYTGADDRPDATYDATIRRVAVITLVISALVAILLGFMFASGLSAIRDSMPVNSTSSGSLEL